MFKFRSIFFAAITILLAGLASCTDILDYPDDPTGDGVADVKVDMVFSSVSRNMNRSRAAGNAIRDVESLCVFIYDSEGNLVRRVRQEELVGLTFENNDKTSPSDAVPEGTHQSEFNTPKASFTIKGVQFGRYQFYAVANMGDLDEEPYSYTDDQLATVSDLQHIQLVWNPNDVSANNQMFGFFSTDASASTNEDSRFSAPVVTVNRSTVSLHAWLQRAASKVTVAIDGSQLYQGVRVWIKSIQVKDIPEQCFLGARNRPSAHLIEPGGKIIVSNDPGAEAADAENLVSQTQNYPNVTADAHTNDADALFFYENMQGQGQLKSQVWPEQGANPTGPMYPDGNNSESAGYKDGKLQGTYVEVVGYYENDGTDPEAKEASSGPIIYRFMLGKDITNNYDAQRNYHFKLTLMLKHNADDSDWHIVYEQTPDIFVKQPFYVSYLYSQGMPYDLRVVGGKLIKLEVEIPNDEVTQKSWAPRDSDVSNDDKMAALNTYPPGATQGGDVYWMGAVNNPGPWNGFLSLRQEPVSDEAADGYGIWVPGSDAFNPTKPETYTENYNHWTTYEQGHRVYWENGDYSESDHADYEITETSPGEYSCKLPLYTKARVMVSQTGYTGNNPYAAYQRASKIIVKATIQKADGTIVAIDPKEIEVVQDRRVMNPKAIWRKGSSNAPFHVRLMKLPHQTAEAFEPLVSDGPWRAVVTQGDWIKIAAVSGESEEQADKSITNAKDDYADDNYIDFIIQPKTTIGDDGTPRGGYVTIYYNNYTCVHTIFVRQGYEPVTFTSCPGVKWHTHNLRTGGFGNTVAYEAVEPEVEGSYFRYHNRKNPIDPRSNRTAYAFKNGVTEGWNMDIAQSDGSYTQMAWDNMANDGAITATWGTFNVNRYPGKQSRLPRKAEWEAITRDPNTIFGYGVMYADGATDTQAEIKQAYGANPENYTSGRGMRGVIMCDSRDGTQMFLPLAASGYGRFKQRSEFDVYNRLPAGWGGVIQYSNRYTWYPSVTGVGGVGDYPVQYHPMFYDLWEGEGTLYWCENEADGTPYALDINFNSLDIAVGKADQQGYGLIWDITQWFPPGQAYTDPSGSDAVHIRLVHDD